METHDKDLRILDLSRQYLDGRMSRRRLIRSLALAGLSIPAISGLLAACGGDDEPPATSATSGGTTATRPSGGGATTTTGGGAAASPAGAVTAPARGKPGGTVVLGVYQEPNSLNWILTGSPISFAMLQLLPAFEALVRYDANSEMEPALLSELPTVQNGGISSDGLTYTLKMRPNIVWDDGQPCTLKDWKFTWQWVMDPKNNAVTTSGWDQIKDIELRDNNLTAVVTLKQIYVPFMAEVIAFWPLLPEHVQSKITTEEYGRKPVGNGPFKFVEWIPGDHITYTRNDRYWRSDKALLERVIFKIVPDRNTVIAQAKTGDIDIGVDYTEAQIPEMEKVTSVTLSITTAPIFERYHFSMVQNDATKPHPIFSDIKVRKALNYAIDRQTIIDKVLFGKTKIAKNDLDNTPWENASITPLSFDQNMAKALLDEAGWRPGSDGIRVKDGKRFTFTHGTTAGNQTRETIQALVQANLKDVGVEMTIANQPASKFFAGFPEGGGYVARELDMVGFTGGLPSSDPNLKPFWHSEATPTRERPGGLNSSGLMDPALDKLLDDQLKEIDPAKRKELLNQAQQIIHDTYPMIPMYDRVSINTINKRLQGVQPITVGGISGLVWNIADWSVNS